VTLRSSSVRRVRAACAGRSPGRGSGLSLVPLVIVLGVRVAGIRSVRTAELRELGYAS
jgi:hypothetical protein